MKQYSFIQEGRIGDLHKIKYGHLLAKYPSNQFPMWKSSSNFWQGYRKERSDMARKLWDQHNIEKFDSKGYRFGLGNLADKLANNQKRSIRRLKKSTGELIHDPLKSTFSRKNIFDIA